MFEKIEKLKTAENTRLKTNMESIRSEIETEIQNTKKERELRER